jgi:Skp family chaperone for outer membrane proteins
MKKIFLLLFSSSIFFLFTTTISFSNEKIIFINLDFVINNSLKGKLIFNDLNKIKEKNIKNLEIDKKNLEKQENEIKLKKDIISKEELDKNLKLLKINVKKFNNKKKMVENELNKLQKEKMDDFINQINVILEKYMTDHSVDIMFNSNNILIGKKSINKTNEILKLVNEKIK